MLEEQAFLWRQRLLAERDRKNLTDLHVRVLLFTQAAIEAGNDQMRHADVAESLKVAVRTVRDVYRRALALGLLGWEAQFNTVHGVRRRTVNRYWLVMPKVDVEASPDVRRHVRKPFLLSSKPTCGDQCAAPEIAVPLHVVRLQMEARLARRWAARQHGG